MLRDDYLLRVIKQLVDVIARLAGYRRRGEFDQAIQAAGEAWSDVLGVPRELVDAMDSRSLADLLRDPDKIRGAVNLLREEALAIESKGDPHYAATLSQKAIELEKIVE